MTHDQKKLSGIIPFDPETDTFYVNAIGSNEQESRINFEDSQEDAQDDEIMKRIIFRPVTILIE